MQLLHLFPQQASPLELVEEQPLEHFPLLLEFVQVMHCE
jgi:hypothetical protein